MAYKTLSSPKMGSRRPKEDHDETINPRRHFRRPAPDGAIRTVTGLRSSEKKEERSEPALASWSKRAIAYPKDQESRAAKHGFAQQNRPRTLDDFMHNSF